MSLASRINDLAGAIRDKINLMVPRLLPAGGTTGQVLKKTSNTDYEVSWQADATGGGGGATVTEVEVDFGATSVRSKAFTITDPAVSPTSIIVIVQSGNAPTDKDADENEMDVLVPRALAGTGQFTLWVDCLTGTVLGKFKFNYLVGG